MLHETHSAVDFPIRTQACVIHFVITTSSVQYENTKLFAAAYPKYAKYFACTINRTHSICSNLFGVEVVVVGVVIPLILGLMSPS